jgi:hypothetical protein
MIYKRNLEAKIIKSLKDNPVVLINGARQTGKSTLAKQLIEQGVLKKYITLDDPNVLSALTYSPVSYLKNLPSGTVIDEVQRLPEMFLPLKKVVDEDRESGKFLLTGSANVLMLPKLADSLAGRMEIFTLRPLAQNEINQNSNNFVDYIFSDNFSSVFNFKFNTVDYFNILEKGGYPLILQLKDEESRFNWFNSYISTLLQRDIKDLANIEQIGALPNLLNLLADRIGGLLSYSDLARSSSISQTTLKRYLNLLEALFLIDYLPPWFNNFSKTLTKSPKIYLNDTGIILYLLGKNSENLKNNRILNGFIMENFIVSEIKKQASFAKKNVKISHLRTNTGQEIDVVLESREGFLIGIEVKTREIIKKDYLKNLKLLKNELKDKFKLGIIFYSGTEVIKFDKDLIALPIQSLWDFKLDQ